MITLKELDAIIPDIINRLQRIRSEVSLYKRINIDIRGKMLMNEIKDKISQIEKVHLVYKTTPSYKNKDFTEWVKILEKYIKECKEYWARIKACEDVPY